MYVGVVGATFAGWFGTPFPEWFGSWWTVVAIAVVIALGTWLLFRSLRRWRQPPRNRDPGSEQAEDELRWLTYRNLPG